MAEQTDAERALALVRRAMEVAQAAVQAQQAEAAGKQSAAPATSPKARDRSEAARKANATRKKGPAAVAAEAQKRKAAKKKTRNQSPAATAKEKRAADIPVQQALERALAYRKAQGITRAEVGIPAPKPPKKQKKTHPTPDRDWATIMGPDAGGLPVELFDTEGSFEDITADVDEAIARLLAEEVPGEVVASWVEATMPDYAVVGLAREGEAPEFVTWPYSLGEPGSETADVVVLGTPEPIDVVGAVADRYSADGSMELVSAEKVIAAALSTKNAVQRRRNLLLTVEEGEDGGVWLTGQHFIGEDGSLSAGFETDEPKSLNPVTPILLRAIEAKSGQANQDHPFRPLLDAAVSLVNEVKTAVLAEVEVDQADRVEAALAAFGDVLADLFAEADDEVEPTVDEDDLALLEDALALLEDRDPADDEAIEVDALAAEIEALKN